MRAKHSYNLDHDMNHQHLHRATGSVVAAEQPAQCSVVYSKDKESNETYKVKRSSVLVNWQCLTTA